VILSRGRAHVYAASGSWSAAVLQFVTGVIVVRALAPGDVGTFVFGSAIAIFLFGIFDLRIEEGLTQFLVREKDAGRAVHRRSALRFAVAVDFASALLIFLLVLAALTMLPFDLSDDTRDVAAIAAATSLIAASDGSFLAVFYADHAFGWLSSYQVVSNAARCLALLVFPISTPVDAAWAFLLAQVVGTGFVLTVVVLRFLPRGALSSSLKSSDRRWLLRFSIHVALASAVATVRTTAIPLVMGVVGTRREVADARVAESPTRLLGVAVAPVRTVLFPRLSAAWARRDRGGARRLIRQYVGAALLLGGVLGLALALTIGFLLEAIYGPAYSDLGRVGQVFVLAALLDAVAGWQKVAPAALDRPWLRTYILAVEAGALLVALLILVPSYGPLGAAISATVAAACSLAMGAYWLKPAFTDQTWEQERHPPESSQETSIADRPH
jgi:O-antigen/teichoic acid export membrane protein